MLFVVYVCSLERANRRIIGVWQRGDGQVRFSKPETGNEDMSVEFTSIATDVTDPNFLVSGRLCQIVSLISHVVTYLG